jgi:RHS repeat-associated protein
MDLEASNVPAGGHEQYRVDALGLRRFGLTFGEGPASSLYHYQPHSERLDFAWHQQSPYADTTWYTQGTTGALTVIQHLHPIQLNQLWYFEHQTTSNNYGVDNRLLAANYSVDTTPTPPNQPNYKVYHRTETYRYDALGRRVWMQMLRDTALNNCQDHDRSSGCRNEVTRTVWDGDQIVYELRAPADTITNLGENDNASGVYNGRVGYTNVPALLGLDQPLDLFKSSTVVIPYTDWRGRFDKGTCPAILCTGIEFAGGAETVFHNQSPGSNGPPSWYGNVIADLRDGSGFEYRRNRYYDPQTGRFTTEDPLGLAGGLNLYGFANGDPANFGDPFGLWPECDYRTGAGCSDEVKRLLQLDRPLRRPIVDPVAVVAGGLAGIAQRLFTGAALGVTEAATAGEAATQLTIQFGRVANQISHTFRHVESLGLDRALVRQAVEEDLRRVASEVVSGRPFSRVIEVAGQRLQYTAFRIEREVINVGRIHPVP